MKITLNILHAVCIGSVILAIGVYLFGSAFNDTVDKQWQSTLNISLLSTIIVVVLTFLLVFWKPGFLQNYGVLRNESIRVAIAFIGAGASLLIAVSPFLFLQ